MSDLIDRYQNLVKTGFEYAEQDKGSAPTSNFEIYMGHFASLFSEIHTALSEAEQQVHDAKRIATNAEHYGYMHGVQAAADIVAELANAQKQAWDEHVASGVKTNATSFHAIFSELASRIRTLIPSEPHDAEGREG